MKKLCTCGVGAGDYHAARHGAQSENQSCVRGKSTITARRLMARMRLRAPPTRCMRNNNKRRNNVVQYYNEPRNTPQNKHR
jgi:hypothetical protein